MDQCQYDGCGRRVERPARGRPPKWCDTHRKTIKVERERERLANESRGCAVAGCVNRHCCKGLCKTHYNRRFGAPDTDPKISVPCAYCGKACWKRRSQLRRYAQSYCSMRCVANGVHGLTTGTTLTPFRPEPALARAIQSFDRAHYRSHRRQRTFRSGPCLICGTNFTSLNLDRTCSASCQAIHASDRKHAAKHRRRARMRDAYRADVIRSDIWTRDKFTCQLCGHALDMGEAVPHPLAPTIDHIVPLARGGTHEPSNVQAAHFLCNAVKSDGRGQEAA